jgi:FkbM family methyltransferase
MIAVYPFSLRDEEQALKNAIWFNDLGGCKGHEVVCCYDPRCSKDIVEAIGLEMLKAFTKVWRLPAESEVDGWPQGANYLFRFSASWLENKQDCPYFLWLEPDAIPVSPGWMDTLEAEYKRGGKPFMGERVDLGEKRPDVPIHMTGIGIYQNPIYMLAGEAYRAHDVAWDIASKDQILPHCHFTKMIQHYWQHGTFTSLDGIRPETVVFHSSKDGSLIDLLRQKAAPENKSSVPTEPTSGSHHSGSPSREEIGTRAAQPIKILPHSGIWVLEGDTIISDQVEREGRLDFDTLIPHVLRHIRPGDTVVDVGAFIGDHTVAYSHAVGKAGKVLAYEPNPLAFQCLVHNTNGMSNVFGFCIALGNESGIISMTDLPNAASNYVDGPGVRTVNVRPLDNDIALFGGFDLIKIDVEGYELNVLKGMEQLVTKFHPKLVVEINEIALKRQDTTAEDVVSWIVRHGYAVSILHRHKDAPFYDILGVPNTPEVSRAAPSHENQSAPSPVAYVTVKEEIEYHVGVLKTLCESLLNQAMVIKNWCMLV